MAKYIKGKSGNPKGRPKGSVTHKKIREAIMKDASEIIDSMIKLAKSGDTTAAKILLDRVSAPMKAGDSLINIPLSGKIIDDAQQVLKAVGSAEITPSQGQNILAGIASLSKIIEVDDLIGRVEALEAKND